MGKTMVGATGALAYATTSGCDFLDEEWDGPALDVVAAMIGEDDRETGKWGHSHTADGVDWEAISRNGPTADDPSDKWDNRRAPRRR